MIMDLAFVMCLQNILRNPIYRDVNKARTENKLPLICPDKQLESDVQNRVNEMDKTKDVSHNKFYQQFEGKEQRGEDIAWGYADKDVVNAWMNSPEHKAVILNPKYKSVGEASKGVYTIIWTK
jgi:uncharacterized protein YkwD